MEMVSAWSEGVRKQGVWLGGLLPYERAAEVWERIGQVNIATSSIWREEQDFGSRLHALDVRGSRCARARGRAAVRHPERGQRRRSDRLAVGSDRWVLRTSRPALRCGRIEADIRPMTEPAPETTLPDHVAENRRHWDANAPKWVAPGERASGASEPTWGMWGIPNSELTFLADELTDSERSSSGAAPRTCRRGCVAAVRRCTPSTTRQAQLATARQLAATHGIDVIEWVHGNAETVPQADGSFDLAISEYGAAIWCDPARWIPEAHRLLRSGGRLTFLGNHPLAMSCLPPDGASRSGSPSSSPTSACRSSTGPRQRSTPVASSSTWRSRRGCDCSIEWASTSCVSMRSRRPNCRGRRVLGAGGAGRKRFPSEQAWELVKR